MKGKTCISHSSWNKKMKPDIQGTVGRLVCLLKWGIKNWVHSVWWSYPHPNSIAVLLKDWSVLQIDSYGYFFYHTQVAEEGINALILLCNLISHVSPQWDCTWHSTKCRDSTDWERSLHSWIPETARWKSTCQYPPCNSLKKNFFSFTLSRELPSHFYKCFLNNRIRCNFIKTLHYENERQGGGRQGWGILNLFYKQS